MSAAKLRRRRYTDAAPTETIAIPYRRVSKVEMARDGLSFGRQLEENRTEIERHAGDGWIAAEEFEDVDSGRKDERPGYQAMLLVAQGYALRRQYVLIVVVAFDRLGRNIDERVRAWKELTALGHQIYAIRQGGIVTEFVYNIHASIAQEESRQIGERQWGIIQGYQEKGWHKPGSAPWGYAWRPATPEERSQGAPKSVLVVDDAEAPAVREAFRRRADGVSYHQIARQATTLPTHERGARNLGYAAIRAMFSRAVYVGRHGAADDEDRGDVLDRPRGRWEPLVDDETWRRCTERDDEHVRMPRQARGDYLLTGLLRCAVCGHRMSGRPRRAIREYFCCSSLLGQAGVGEQRCYATVETRAIEQPVDVAITELVTVASDARIGELVRRAQVAHERREHRDDPAVKRARIERELVQIAEGVKKASAAWFLEEITREEYDGGRAEMMAKRERLQAELVTLGPQRAVTDPLRSDIAALVSCARGCELSWATGDTVRKRDVLGVLVEEIRPVRYARGKYSAAMRYTAIGRALLGLRQALAELEGDADFLQRPVAVPAAADAVVRVVSGVDHSASVEWLTPDTTARVCSAS